jgi:hypothetical protein
MPAKKADSGYAALRGHIPKDLYKRFRIHCLERDVDNSQGLEDLIREYFEFKDKQDDSDRPADPQPTEPEPAAKPAATAKATTAKAKAGRDKS